MTEIMKKTTETVRVPVEVEYTEGYQERFTKLILKIYEKRRRNNIENFKGNKKIEGAG